MRILIAEDEGTSRTLLEALVRKWGYDPVVLTDGDSAWSALQQPDAPLLAILDWNMPGMSGLEICRRIRALETEEPPYLIILSARSEKGSIVEGLEAGANDYVIKPFDSAELWARVRVGQRMLEMQAAMNLAKRALAHEATHDPLTGTLNRRAILDALNKELSRSRRQGTSLSIGLMDIDHFKQINDRYGHQAGDDVLCRFVATIQESLRNYDLLGRVGGEEFLVVAPGSSGRRDEGFYERLRAAVAGNGMETRAGLVPVTVSIGVTAAAAGSSVESLLAAADAELYRAKNDGRNRVAYDPQVGTNDSRGALREVV